MHSGDPSTCKSRYLYGYTSSATHDILRLDNGAAHLGKVNLVVMNTVRDIMATEAIWLTPTNKVKTAILLMKGHNIGGLPVLDEDKVIGIVDYRNLLGKDDDIPIEHVMDREFVSVSPEMPVASAADLMSKTGAERLLVMEQGQFVGTVTPGDLLPELGKSLDPLTELPRADALRDWGIAALKGGTEISIIFVDLDDFGQFNKQYGHVVGDNVLKHVAGILQANVEERKDLLCRYAGDEFVVVTTRTGDEAGELASLLDEGIRHTENADLPESVTASIGVHGGKRTKEREDVHFAATLDNLINLASKACTLAKGKRTGVLSLDSGAPAAAASQAAPAPPEAPPATTPRAHVSEAPRLNMHSLNFSWESGSLATVEVQLVRGESVHSHTASGFALGNNALRLVADAVAGAICKFLPAGFGVVVDNVHPIGGDMGEDVVLVSTALITPQTDIKLVGSAIVKQDRYRATAAALLDAVNRQISSVMQNTTESQAL